MTEKPRETQAESHVVELKEKVNNSSLMKHRFSTLISTSFVQTGRIFDDGVRRLRQNNRHQLEIFWPGGLVREGKGWKLSVRIRFVHARVRYLLSRSEEWDFDAYGIPISAAK